MRYVKKSFVIIFIIFLFSCSEKGLVEPKITEPIIEFDFQTIEEFSKFARSHEYDISFMHEFLGRQGWSLWVEHYDKPEDNPFVDLIVDGHEINAYVHNCRCSWMYRMEDLIGYDLEFGQEIFIKLSTIKGESNLSMKMPEQPVLMNLPEGFEVSEDFFIEWDMSQDSDLQMISITARYKHGFISHRNILKSDIRSYILPADTFPAGDLVGYGVSLRNLAFVSLNNDFISAETFDMANVTFDDTQQDDFLHLKDLNEKNITCECIED